MTLPERNLDSAGANAESLSPAQALGLPDNREAVAAWPDPLRPEALHGLAGEVVKIVEPHSEADPAAILVQFLTAAGSAIGREAETGFRAESTFHGTNLYTLVVGKTSKGRKGSSWAQARQPVELADEAWASRIVSGISSGEGLLHAARDPIEVRRKAKKKEREDGEADLDGYMTEVTDEGESDKRVLAYESEFASVLRVMRREGSTVGMVIRQAWESGDLRTLTRNSPLKATGAHVSMVGHVSEEELRRELLTTDAASGFANRLLFVCARRSKQLPEGGNITQEDWEWSVKPKLIEALRFGQTTAGQLPRDDEAKALWAEMYGELSDGKLGMVGAVTSRAEAQVMRLAVIYAVLDCASAVRVEHLKAARAVWDYCEASAQYIFRDALGDETADTILAGLQRSGSEGLTRTDIQELFSRHGNKTDIERALGLLASLGLAEEIRIPTGGRPKEVWIAGSTSNQGSDRPPETGTTLSSLNSLSSQPELSQNGAGR